MDIDFAKIKKILVIQLRHHGDVLLTTPLLYTLKKEMPEADLDVYIYKEAAPMLEGLPFIHTLKLYDKGWKKQGFFYRYTKELKMLFNLRKESYDLVINMTEGDRGALVSLLSNASYTIGLDPKKTGMWLKEKCYTKLSKERPGIKHKVEMNLDILRDMGIHPSVEDRYLQFVIPNKDQASALDLLKLHHLDEFYLIHPVSRWMFKSWPVDKVAELMKQIYEETKVRFVITGSPAREEMDYILQLVQKLPEEIFVNFAGKINLKELGALIQKAKIMVSVDSVPMHMAAALKTPLVAIFGPTSEKRWAPWQHPHAVIVYNEMACRPCYKAGCNDSHRSECLESLPIEEVKKAFYKLKL